MDASKVQILRELKNQISDLNDQLKLLKHKQIEVEDDLMESMRDSGLTLGRTEFGTVSLNESIVPTTDDWAELEEFVYDNRMLYLYQRRLSATAYRDELKIREKIPGVKSFVKTTLSLTKAPSK